MAKAIERHLCAQDDLFGEQAAASTLSTEAAYWVERICRQIVRDGRFRAHHPVSEPSTTPNAVPPDVVCSPQRVFIDQIEHTHGVVLGPLLVAKAAWEQLELSKCLRELGFDKRQITAAAASVMSRLVRPSSEYALVQWIPTTALPELLGDQVLDFDHKYFYRVSDKLLENQRALEAHLRQQSRKLFSLERTILLYDLTNTYFEGQGSRNPKAKRGVSKEKRHDRPLVVLGMIYDGNGFALAHKTFAGNTNDGASLVKIAQELEASRPEEDLPAQAQLDEGRACRGRTLVVVDAGVATAANLKLLREAGFSYLVNDSRRQRGRYQAEFADRAAFTRLRGRFMEGDKQPVEVRLLQELTRESDPTADGTQEVLDTILLCRSYGRECKEKAMFSNAERRFLEALEKLDERLKSGRLKEPKKIQQALGRLKAKHPRVQRLYEVTLEDPATGGLVWRRCDALYDDHRELFGCYALRTDSQDFTATELWRVYMGLTQAEEGFRALKTDLGLRPNFHHREDRVDGHIFITVLAYQLWKWIRQKFDLAGERRDWVTVRRVLETHCYSTLSVPAEDGTIHHLRKPGRPEVQQQAIYDMVGLSTRNLPKSKIEIQRP
jgi:transposase